MPCLAARFSATLTPSFGIQGAKCVFATFARTRDRKCPTLVRVVFSSCAPAQMIAVGVNNSFAKLKALILVPSELT